MIRTKKKWSYRVMGFVLALAMMLTMLPITTFASMGEKLTGDERLVYDALVPHIKKIASGERPSTVIAVGNAIDGYPVDTEVTFNDFSGEFDLPAVMRALVADHPYEMYWYGKFCQTSMMMYGSKMQYIFYFSVAQNYQGTAQYTVDPQKTTMAATVAENAKKVVADNADKNDYEKLIAYRDYICNAVSYDHEAAENSTSSVNNGPWQLISVFDGDKDTSVVCEGYAKAFQYLCDLSDFNDPTFACYTATGWMSGGTGQGPHMWNIVTLGGQNYLVDVTNSDTQTIGEDGELFLAGSSKTISATFTLTNSDGSTESVVRNGYQFIAYNTPVNFYYDEDTIALLSNQILTLAETAYTVNENAFDISFASMTMANSLDMNFAFEKGHVDDWTGHYAVIRKTYADGREDVTQTVPYEAWKSTTINGIAHYYVTFNGIAAKEMTDDIYVTIYNAAGEAVSNIWRDSVRAQAMRTLAQEGVTNLVQTMIVDMLYYGAVAQASFEYATDNLATALLTDTQKGFATADTEYTDTHTGSENYVASSLYLKSNIQLLLAFKDIDPSMHATVTFTNHRGVAKTITIDGSEFAKNGNYYVVTVDDIVVADGRQDVTCTIYNENDEEVAKVTDSMESYVARASNLADAELFERIMKFSDSAYAYLHGN